MNRNTLNWSLLTIVILGCGVCYGALPGDTLYSFRDIQYIQAGDYGGKWESLESGETAYVFPNGESARSQWVMDRGRLYYVDNSGCRMADNYSHDGYYVGSNGILDRTVPRMEQDLQPREGKPYTDDSGTTWTFWLSSGKARMAYPADIGYQANYSITPLGRSVYLLYNVDDEFDRWHAVVLDGGKRLRVSGAGVTEEFTSSK